MQPQLCPLPAFDGSGDDITPRRVVETRAMINMTHPGQIMISIQMISDQKLNIFAPPSSTVLSVKHQIAETIKVDTDNQRLLFSGKVLQDDSTLEDYGLETGSIIQLCTCFLSSTVLFDCIADCDVCSHSARYQDCYAEADTGTSTRT
jgi:hypothetical protein